MQVDNTIIIQGRVVKGPMVSYVNGDSSKMRVKYQVQIETRKKDNFQTFTPWVRSLGNQAKKDFENIKIGDLISVSGRLVTRNEIKKRYLQINEDGMSVKEIDIEEFTDEELEKLDNILTFEDRKMITEIQADDVRYFSKSLESIPTDELTKMVSAKVLQKALEGIKKSEEEAKQRQEEFDKSIMPV